MITVSEAIEIAIAKEGGRLAVNPDRIVETSYGWVIFPNSQQYVETGDRMSKLIGSGGVLVLRNSGKAIRFDSSKTLERSLEIYESGYLEHDNWDIVVTTVFNEREAVDLVLALQATYVVPEEESGIVWKIPQFYSPQRMKELVRRPPMRLNIGEIYFISDAVDELKRQRAFDYRLEPNCGYENVP